MSAKINKLLIKVNSVPAGHITTRKTGDGGTRYSFNYLANAGPEQALSVTMPVRDESYATWQMPPVLEMSLPEGLLKAHLESRFAKTVSMDPTGLLFVTGRARIGNITAELPEDNTDPHLAELDAVLAKHRQQRDPIDSTEITRVTDSELKALFERLLERYAIGSGVGGVQPKVLARTVGRTSGNRDTMTLRTPGHIVKTSDDDSDAPANSSDRRSLRFGFVFFILFQSSGDAWPSGAYRSLVSLAWFPLKSPALNCPATACPQDVSYGTTTVGVAP